jgi:hypothetical protein
MAYKFSVIMNRILLFILIFISLSDISGASEKIVEIIEPVFPISKHDTFPDKQLLLNGRILERSYSNTIGDEFLFTREWLTGDININEITFHNIKLKYDIYNDQLLTAANQAIVVQLNKEMIKKFTLTFENTINFFEKFDTGKDNPVNGFARILYKGGIYLIIKYVKNIQELAVNGKFDEFYQLQKIYIIKGGNFYKVSSRKDLINILSDKKLSVQKYIKENKIRIRIKDPASLIPVIKFYDTLKNAF